MRRRAPSRSVLQLVSADGSRARPPRAGRSGPNELLQLVNCANVMGLVNRRQATPSREKESAFVIDFYGPRCSSSRGTVHIR